MARVLRIPCHDEDKSFVLIHVNTSPGGSSRPLDLRLVGTEGAAPYVLNLKHIKVSSLKAKNSPWTQEEWSVILESILLGKAIDEGQSELLENIEAVASVEENKSINVTIRKRINGITQRLGAFQLSYDEDQEIELFEWCGIAIQSTSTSTQELSSLNAKYIKQQETITKLNAQLEELIAAKASHETELLEKFCDLLNEKKSKIRDQQRLLASAKVDPKKLAAIQESRESRKAAGPSRSGKRKAEAENGGRVDKDEDDEDSFEKMDLDVDQVPNDSDQEALQTPDEDGTASEDDDDDMPPVEPPARSTRQAVAEKEKSAAKTVANSKATDSKTTKVETKEEPPKTPPRRDLPFAKKPAQPAKPAVDDAGDETASEDDEL